MAYSF